MKSKLNLATTALAAVLVASSLSARQTTRGYEVEYIESGGSEYIDTGIKPTKDIHLVLDMAILNASANAAVFGLESQTVSYSMYRNTASSAYWGYTHNDGSASWQNSGYPADTARHVFDFNRYIAASNAYYLVYDGREPYKELAGSITKEGKYTLYLGGRRRGSGAPSYYSSHRIWSCRIYDGETIVRDFVPWDYISGEKGLWELTENKFYKSKNSGGYSAGGTIATNRVYFFSEWEDKCSSTPAFNQGAHRYAHGDTVTASFASDVLDANDTYDDGVDHIRFAGWRLWRNGQIVATGPGKTASFTHDASSYEELEWYFEASFHVNILTEGPGTVSTNHALLAEGDSVSVTATPAPGMAFFRWKGDLIVAQDQLAETIAVTADRARTLTAEFYNPATEPRVYFEAVDSDDNTQWINTRYCVNPTTWAVYDAQYLQTQGQAVLFGNDGPLYWIIYQKNEGAAGSTDALRYWFNTSSSGYADTGKKTDRNRHIFYCNYKLAPTTRGFRSENPDGSVHTAEKSYALQSKSATSPLCIGTRRRTLATRTRHRVYSLTMYEDDSDDPVRDFVPAAMRGVTGLWERAEGRFYPSDAYADGYVGGGYVGYNPITNHVDVVSADDWIDVQPAFGRHVCTNGDTIAYSAPAIVTNGTLAAVCTGWRRFVNDLLVEQGTGNSFSREKVWGLERVEWFFTTAYQVEVTASAGGSLETSGAGEWFANGTTNTVTATAIPDEGYEFFAWSGDLPAGVDIRVPTISLQATAAASIKANFRRLDGENEVTVFEYVQSEDERQYINTGYTVTPTTWAVFDMQYLMNEGQAALISVRGPLYWGLYQRGTAARYSNGKLGYWFNTNSSGYDDTGKNTDTVRHIYRCNYKIDDNTRGFRGWNVDGTAFTSQKTFALQTASSTKPLLIGVQVEGDGSSASSRPTHHRVYGATLYEDAHAEPIHDLLPAAMCGATGLWDRVTGVFHRSMGGGNYVVGGDPVTDRLYVFSDWADMVESTPAFGATNGLAPGQSITYSVSATTTNGATAIVCSGYVFRRNGLTVATGAGNSATVTHQNGIEKLDWLYDVFHRIDVAAGEGGSVSSDGGWLEEGESMSVTATPSSGYMFYRWTGDIPDGADATSATLSIPADIPRAVTATFSPATASGVKLYTGADYGDWDTASNWTPEGVPTATDSVFIPASVGVRIPLTADVFSLTVSNAALVNVNGPASKPSSISGQTAGNTATTDPVGLNVRGDLLLLGSAKLGIGGKNQHSHPHLSVGGNFTMEGSSAFAIHAGPIDDEHDYVTGGAKVTVGGMTTIGSSCVVHPWSHFTTAKSTSSELSSGSGVVFDLHGFVLEEGGLINGYGKGFPRYYRFNSVHDAGSSRIGGSHGGRGGAVSESGSRNSTYGRPYAPIYPGKPGGNAQTDGSGRIGGSAIRIAATTIRLDGTIMMDGAAAEGGGGAAGGSVFLLCDDIQFGHAAKLSASGRSAGEYNTPSGGGGGGRIAIALGLTQEQSASLLADGELPSGVAAHEATALVPDGRLIVAGAIGNQPYVNWDDGEDGTAYYLVNGDFSTLTVATTPATRAEISPSAGLHAYASATTVTATAPETADASLDPSFSFASTSASAPAAIADSGSRRVCAGWTLTDAGGTVVASGDTTNAVFTIGIGAHTLTWNYDTLENRLDVSATEGGTVPFAQEWAASNGRFPALTATPDDAEHVFAYWTGDVDATNRFDNPLSLPADRARNVMAVFASATPTTYTWNRFQSSVAHSWHDAANWTPRGIPGPHDSAIVSRDSGTQANPLVESYACVSNLVVCGAQAYLRVGCTTSSFGNHTAGYHSPLASVTSPIGLDVRGDLAVTNSTFLILGGELLKQPAYLNVGGDLVVGGGDASTRCVIFGSDATAIADSRFNGTSRITVAGRTTVLDKGEIFATEHSRTDGYAFLSLGDLSIEQGGAVAAYSMGVKNFVRSGSEYNYPWPTHQQNASLSYFGGSHGGRGGATAKDAGGAMQYVGEVYGCTNTPVHSGMQGGNSGGRPGGVVRVDARTVTLSGSFKAYGANGGASSGGGAGGSVWVTCEEFHPTETASIDVSGGTPTKDGTGAGGGGRASVCVGLTDEQLVALRASDEVEGVLRTPLVDIVPGFTAAGGDCGGWSGSSGEEGTGVYIVHVGAGVTLTTSGDPIAAGIVSPAYGVTGQPSGEPFAIEAPETADMPGAEGSARYVCAGYLVTNAAGTVLATGEGRTATLTLDEDAFLTWFWNIEHHVTVAVSEGGSITTNQMGDASSEWQAAGSGISLTAVADPGYVFIGWLGDAQGLDRSSATLEFDSDQGRALTARFATSASGVKTWIGGTGDWMNDDGWDPRGIPGPNTETHVPSGLVLLDSGFPAPVGSLFISGGARVGVATEGTGDGAAPTENDYASDTVGLRVAGDLDLGGALYVGGWNQLRTSLLEVGGALVLTNGSSSVLYVFAGCRDDRLGDPAMFREGGAKVRVAGRMRVGGGATVSPICASLSGAPVIFQLGSLLLEEDGRFSANYGGYCVRTSAGELIGYAPGAPQTRAEFLATPYRGGSYGGKGGGTKTTATYGVDFAPYQPGSPGGNAENGRAGGAIRIDCTRRAELYGTIAVNGAVGTSSRGGRSGGAIWITAKKIVSSSTASLQAKGGNQVDYANSLAGGGGRICLAQGLTPEQIASLYEAETLPRRYEKTDLLTDTVPEWLGTVNVSGGSLAARPANDGHPGTAVFVRAPVPHTVILLR